MSKILKKMKKSFKKAKPVFKKGRKYARKVVNNIDDYFELDHREARKMRPRS